MKVYGYMRSGNNILVDTLWRNFLFELEPIKFNYNDSRFDSMNYISDFSKKEERGDSIIFEHFRLIGNHGLYQENENYNNAIYIMRDPIDVLKSEYRIWNYKISFSAFANRNKINYWLKHVNSFLKNGVYCITYNQLVKDSENTLTKIEQKFNLKRKNEKFTIEKKKVGWVAKKEKEIPENDIKLVKNLISKIVPRNILDLVNSEKL